MKLAQLLLLSLLTIAPAGHAALVLPDARPPITAFSPNLDVYPQNFSIAVDSRSRVYLGNADGVLVYDGAYWQQVPVSNGDIVRWLKYDGDRRVYVGGYDAFGYLEQSGTGTFVYHELSTLFQDQLGDELFADIWRIEISADAVYFVGLGHLFRYEPASGAARLWRHSGSFGAIAWFQNRLLLQFRGEGIKYYDNGEWRLLDGPDLSTSFLDSMLELGDKLLIISSDDHWYEFDGSKFEPLPMAGTIPHKSSVTKATVVNDTTLVLTTQLGKIIFYEPATGRSQVVEVSSGFIPAAAISPSGDVLVVDDLGFYSVQWPARWTIIAEGSGLSGSINRILAVDKATVVLSSSGAFKTNANGDRFERLDWTDYEAWDMLPLEDGSILFADSYEIVLLAADGSTQTIDRSTTARLLVRSRFDPDVVYAGTEWGLQVIQRINGRWESVYRNDKMDNLRVTQIIEASAGELWLGSERGGIRKVQFDTNDGWQMSETKYGTADGLDYGDMSHGAFIFEHRKKLYASTGSGIYQWQQDSFVADDFDGLASLNHSGYPLKFAEHKGQQWAYQFNHLYRRNGKWQQENVATLKQGMFSALEFIDDRAYVGNLGAILVFDESQHRSQLTTTPLSLSAARVYSSDGANTTRALALDKIELSSDDNRLTLQYALPDLAAAKRVHYRTRLLPRETSFSSWGPDSQQSFVTLAPGNYEFQIEARDSQGQVSSLSVPISVLAQWHELLAVRLVAGLALLGALLLVATKRARRRARSLLAERDNLEAMVHDRTRALQSVNQQLDQMANLDGLTRIPNRRRVDAYLGEVHRYSAESNRLMAVAIIDADHFKQYNDTYGHQAGDELLVRLAGMLSDNLRRGEDMVARYGGEEFLVVMPGADEKTAVDVVEEMRRCVADSDLGITISAGVFATTARASVSVNTMIEAADAALYQAKREGRNQVKTG
jgi:diguanylate cyclase (GGDEF)-like protein